MTGPAAATTEKDGSRTYTIPTDDGELRLPSVTTILGIVAKPALMYWAANTAAQYALDNMETIINDLSISKRKEVYDRIRKSPWERRDTAAAKGSDAHATIERFLLGEAIAPEEQTPYFVAALNFIEDNNLRLEATEATVYNLTEGYAGTLDALLWWHDSLGAVDWKTRQGKRKSETGIWESELLQVAAYARAEFLLLPDGSSVPMPVVSGGSVVALCEDGFKIGVADVDRDFGGFLHAKGLFDWKREVDGK